MTCKDNCLHYKACKSMIESFGYDVKEREQDGLNADTRCEQFEDKDLYVKLPCKIGDTVYYLATECDDCYSDGFYCRRYCKKPQGIMKVKSTIIKQFYGIDMMSDSNNVFDPFVHYFHPKDIGKTVFFTQKEAEEAIKEKYGEQK